MKKYGFPKIEVISFEATDIIQASGEIAEKQELETLGVNIGETTASSIFEA